MSRNPALTVTDSRGQESVTSPRYDLAFFIGWANELPPDFEPPEPPANHPNLFHWLLENLPGDLAAWNGLRERQMRMRLRGERKYGDLDKTQLEQKNRIAYDVRKTLRAIAETHEREVAETRIPMPVALSGRDEVAVNHDRTIRVVNDPLYQDFVEALNGKDATRIRICPECGRLYLAARKHKQACSSACRVRKWRRLHTEQWEQRQANYEAMRAERERTQH